MFDFVELPPGETIMELENPMQGAKTGALLMDLLVLFTISCHC